MKASAKKGAFAFGPPLCCVLQRTVLMALHRRQFAEAESILDGLEASRPDLETTRALRALVAWTRGRPDMAAEMLSDAIRSHPPSWLAQALQVHLARHEGHNDADLLEARILDSGAPGNIKKLVVSRASSSR